MNLTSLLVIVVAALALVLLSWRLKARGTLGRWDKDLKETEQLCTKLRDFGSEYAALQKKHAEVLASVESIVAERNAIMEQYHRQAAEHANAQDMMMREVKLLTMQYEWLPGPATTAPGPGAARAARASARKTTGGNLVHAGPLRVWQSPRTPRGQSTIYAAGLGGRRII